MCQKIRMSFSFLFIEARIRSVCQKSATFPKMCFHYPKVKWCGGVCNSRVQCSYLATNAVPKSRTSLKILIVARKVPKEMSPFNTSPSWSRQAFNTIAGKSSLLSSRLNSRAVCSAGRTYGVYTAMYPPTRTTATQSGTYLFRFTPSAEYLLLVSFHSDGLFRRC